MCVNWLSKFLLFCTISVNASFYTEKNATENLKLEPEAKSPNKTVKRACVEGANGGKELHYFDTAAGRESFRWWFQRNVSRGLISLPKYLVLYRRLHEVHNALISPLSGKLIQITYGDFQITTITLKLSIDEEPPRQEQPKLRSGVRDSGGTGNNHCPEEGGSM